MNVCTPSVVGSTRAAVCGGGRMVAVVAFAWGLQLVCAEDSEPEMHESILVRKRREAE